MTTAGPAAVFGSIYINFYVSFHLLEHLNNEFVEYVGHFVPCFICRLAYL